MSDDHEVTPYGRADVKLGKTLDDFEQIDEMSDYVSIRDWKVTNPPEIDFWKCSCGAEFSTALKAETHLLKNETEDEDEV